MSDIRIRRTVRHNRRYRVIFGVVFEKMPLRPIAKVAIGFIAVLITLVATGAWLLPDVFIWNTAHMVVAAMIIPTIALLSRDQENPKWVPATKADESRLQAVQHMYQTVIDHGGQ